MPYIEAINWTERSVRELKQGEVTNSRWQGETFFANSGFGWVDYFTDSVKAFYLEPGVYSKSIVKLHSLADVSDLFLVCILNSSIVSYIIRSFITNTRTLQINDGRLIPIVIPTAKLRKQVENCGERIISLRKRDPMSDVRDLERQIDELAYDLYGVRDSEVKFVEGSTDTND